MIKLYDPTNIRSLGYLPDLKIRRVDCVYSSSLRKELDLHKPSPERNKKEKEKDQGFQKILILEINKIS